jgi:hypothetical protein
MKTGKRITVLLAIMSFIAVQGFSQNASTSVGTTNSTISQTAASTTPGKIADNDKVGVCDKHQAKMINGKCANWVDKNGDGICDNCKSNCQGKGNCKGSGMGCQKGQGNCCKGGNGCQMKNGSGNQKLPDPEIKKSKD